MSASTPRDTEHAEIATKHVGRRPQVTRALRGGTGAVLTNDRAEAG